MTSFFVSQSLDETASIATLFAKKLQPGAVIAFFGDLGVGKTTFIKALAKEAAGIQEECVNSPTFQYLNMYQGRYTLYHFDLWRIGQASDFLKMGFEEMFEQGGICCIEWAERIEGLLPKGHISIKMAHGVDNSRSIGIIWPT